MTPNIPWIKKAADNLGLDFEVLNVDGGLARLNFGQSYYFINCATPFNRQDFVRIAKDKYFTYLILKDIIKVPKTISFVDPNSPTKLQNYVHFKSINKILDEAVLQLGENIIVKKNSGQRKENVFFCENRQEILKAFQEIFNKNSSKYDYIGLAQERIQIKQEYRVLVGFNEVQMVYQKWKFIRVDDELLIQKIRSFCAKISSVLSIGFAGLDIALNQEDELVLIEINSAPRLEFYVRKYGEKEVISLFEKLLYKFTQIKRLS